ncbi:3-hydroxyacyl-CoA dehydrogenase NAD-binding domain-containing protein [Streptomyces sp. NPDC091219]|uniref:3-hydroxyacyl-CoA dehydrogenase family protein n=1 Tax=Streptomyces sp. NPDC091219 TaxID=3155193 RepID=UPI00344F860D
MTSTVDFLHVAVIGAGTMGSGIAQVAAQSGRRVTVLEVDAARVVRGIDGIAAFLDGSVARGKIDTAERAAILGRIKGVTDVGDLAGADLVIEAATENAEVKRSILAQVAQVVGKDTIIVTNTSALSVTDLATAVTNPTRFAGLHFFNPAQLMRVVEIVAALQTDDAVVDRLMALVASFGKDPVVVKDRPGFLVNHLLMPYLNDVVREYDDGLASADDIDTALKLGLGYKLGPLELLDLIGLDVHDHATTSAYEATQDPCYASPPLLRQMVAAGFLGNKNARGFRVGKAGSR